MSSHSPLEEITLDVICCLSLLRIVTRNLRLQLGTKLNLEMHYTAHDAFCLGAAFDL